MNEESKTIDELRDAVIKAFEAYLLASKLPEQERKVRLNKLKNTVL